MSNPHQLTKKCCCVVICTTAIFCPAGCQKSAPSIPAAADQVVTGANADAAQTKKWLELIAKSGEGGSSLDGLKDAIDKLQIDQAKKDGLLKELTVLQRATAPDKIKASAGKMAAML